MKKENKTETSTLEVEGEKQQIIVLNAGGATACAKTFLPGRVLAFLEELESKIFKGQGLCLFVNHKSTNELTQKVVKRRFF